MVAPTPLAPLTTVPVTPVAALLAESTAPLVDSEAADDMIDEVAAALDVIMEDIAPPAPPAVLLLVVFRKTELSPTR
jgi:hypothetical protein